MSPTRSSSPRPAREATPRPAREATPRPGRASTFGTLAAAEFFAGIGLVRAAVAEAGVDVVWANDIHPMKARLYAANYPADHYVVGDVRDVRGAALPAVDLATASFPCTDLSLAGWRRGLAGEQSGLFWEFARVLDEMGRSRPRAVLLENVPGFATSRGGRDLEDAVARLNDLGYSCDVFQVDARWFVPQSRPRLFIVGTTDALWERPARPDELRPLHLVELARRRPDLRLHAAPLALALPRRDTRTLADVVERLPASDERWWDPVRTARFVASLSPLQAERLRHLRDGAGGLTWRTAYRRTRAGVAVWEVRPDPIAGCLRTARGGSSKQALVEAGSGRLRVRWMSGREYARLQGVNDDFCFAGLSRNKVMFGFGDAVCVPVVAWIAQEYLVPALAAAGVPVAAACG